MTVLLDENLPWCRAERRRPSGTGDNASAALPACHLTANGSRGIPQPKRCLPPADARLDIAMPPAGQHRPHSSMPRDAPHFNTEHRHAPVSARPLFAWSIRSWETARLPLPHLPTTSFGERGLHAICPPFLNILGHSGLVPSLRLLHSPLPNAARALPRAVLPHRANKPATTTCPHAYMPPPSTMALLPTP